MVLIFIASVVLMIIALIGTILVGKNPDERNYHSEKVKNMSRLFWIYSVVLIALLALSLGFLFFT